MRVRAFTLIELLVVIAIISVLFAVIVPALNLARQKASTAVCMSNTKNLSLGWLMYMEENNGRIMSAVDTGTERDGRYVGWIGIPRTADGTLCSITQTNPPVTDEDEIRGIEAGLLFPYVKNPSVYNCPGDKIRLSLYDQTRVFVSYSIPNCLYGHPNDQHARYALQIRRFSEITSPSTRYIFVEAGETRNWNSSHHFVIGSPEWTNLAAWAWWGPIAINHGQASILGFADGHSEVRRWRDRYTIDRVEKLIRTGETSYGRDFPPADETQDIDYMAAGWAYRHRLAN